MRNKFTELVQQGVATFSPKPIAQEVPENDPICREYNNLFGLVSDTHMSCTPEGGRIITGHMIGTKKWDEFATSHVWGTFEIDNGYWSLADWAYHHNFKLVRCLGRDCTICVEDIPVTPSELKVSIPQSYTTSESKIPQNIIGLTTNGDVMKVKECFGDTIEMVVKNLNESIYIKGNNWIHNGENIMGLVGNKVYIL